MFKNYELSLLKPPTIKIIYHDNDDHNENNSNDTKNNDNSNDNDTGIDHENDNDNDDDLDAENAVASVQAQPVDGEPVEFVTSMICTMISLHISQCKRR